MTDASLSSFENRTTCVYPDSHERPVDATTAVCVATVRRSTTAVYAGTVVDTTRLCSTVC
jgi:uncharacterized protein YciW